MLTQQEIKTMTNVQLKSLIKELGLLPSTNQHCKAQMVVLLTDYYNQF